MQFLKRYRTWVAVLLAASQSVASQSIALLRAQQPLEGQRLDSRTVCALSPDSVIEFAETGCSLTRDGQRIIATEESGEFVSFRTSDLSRQVIDTPSRIRFSWVDSQTDAIFVFTTSAPKNKRNVNAPLDLYCFENFERLIWWQPTWSRHNVPIARSGIHWVPGKKLYARFCFSMGRKEETIIYWIDPAGIDVAGCKVPGMLVGIDTSPENETEVYFLTRDGKMKVAVFPTLGEDAEKIGELFFSQNLRSASSFPELPGRWAVGTRMYRLDALQPGDVRRMVADRMSHPLFFTYQDLAVSINDPLYLRCLGSSYGRLHNLGILSAAKDETDFEIIGPQVALGSAEYCRACIVNRAGTLLPFPRDHTVMDATKHRGAWTFLTRSVENNKAMLSVSTLVPAK